LKHLLSNWPAIVNQLKDSSHILFFTDYDGTLTAIKEKPELAILPGEMRVLLEEVAQLPRFTLGVISGRAIADLKGLVGIRDILYVGNHGLEIEGPLSDLVFPGAALQTPLLKILNSALRRALEQINGVLVENKEFSLSVHHRLADEQKTGEIETIVNKILKEAVDSGMVTITAGKKVLEVRLKINWDKGEAIKYLINLYSTNIPKKVLFPMYFGDDLTDEDGFEAINAHRIGLSVLIGEETQPSAARYYLKSPLEMAEFLGLLLEHVKNSSGKSGTLSKLSGE
jgi:trehalose 6-phosphate phosphatase